MSSGYSVVGSYPPELLATICAHIYASGLPPPNSCLDPPDHSEDAIPTSLPASYPSPFWPETIVRKTLLSLTRVNRTWYEAAKPWLWRRVEIRLPGSWLSIVEEVAGGDDEQEELDAEQAASLIGETVQAAQHAVFGTREMYPDGIEKDLHDLVLEKLSGPDGSVPPELLSPAASRDPSPRRIRAKSKSPARWKLIRSISAAVQDVIDLTSPGTYVPTLEDPRVGRYVRHLDFNHFRTIGMRRSVDEGVNNRFVTGERLHAVLKELPNLRAFGATEYMDSALTVPVLKELFLRGSASHGRGRPARGRDIIVSDPNDPDAEDRERRRECKELDALDLTGCMSGVFVNALSQFVTDHLLETMEDFSGTDEDDEAERGRPRSRAIVHEEPLAFAALLRLGLRGVKSVPSHILNPFVLASTSLTHLDLSCTRVTPDLLAALALSRTVRLSSLALERCHCLTGESIRAFLVDAPAVQDLRELSLYGDWTYPSPLSTDDLQNILLRAPCLRSGRLVYLDFSSSPLTDELMRDAFAPQPNLRSFGLSHIRDLSLTAISDFLKTKASNVEVLTLVTSTSDLGHGAQPVSPRKAPVALHSALICPLCTPPFSFSLTGPPKQAPPPTRLRVIELAPPLLAALGSGAGAWRAIRSKGGRGWYVDIASGWIADPSSSCEAPERMESVLRRDLEEGHPWRAELERLADANGNVSSGVGWHARKMEVLHGQGLLGREAGLYGAVSFAYQG